MPTTPPPVIQVSVETPLAQTTLVALPQVRHVSMSAPVAPGAAPNAANWLGNALVLWQRHPQAGEPGSDNLGMNPATPGH
jgi:hypothetical protein